MSHLAQEAAELNSRICGTMQDLFASGESVCKKLNRNRTFETDSPVIPYFVVVLSLRSQCLF